MKANDVPEKVYVNFPFGERHPEIGPMVTKQGLNAEDIEYTRTDAFIEKASEWLRYNNDLIDGEVDDYVEDFVNYMKGE